MFTKIMCRPLLVYITLTFKYYYKYFYRVKSNKELYNYLTLKILNV